MKLGVLILCQRIIILTLSKVQSPKWIYSGDKLSQKKKNFVWLATHITTWQENHRTPSFCPNSQPNYPRKRKSSQNGKKLFQVEFSVTECQYVLTHYAHERYLFWPARMLYAMLYKKKWIVSFFFFARK